MTAQQPPTTNPTQFYCTDGTECASRTPGSHSVCALRTPLEVTGKFSCTICYYILAFSLSFYFRLITSLYCLMRSAFISQMLNVIIHVSVGALGLYKFAHSKLDVHFVLPTHGQGCTNLYTCGWVLKFVHSLLEGIIQICTLMPVFSLISILAKL